MRGFRSHVFLAVPARGPLLGGLPGLALGDSNHYSSNPQMVGGFPRNDRYLTPAAPLGNVRHVQDELGRVVMRAPVADLPELQPVEYALKGGPFSRRVH